MGEFFVLRAEEVEDAKLFVLRRKKFHPPTLQFDLRPIFRGRRSKMGRLFDLRIRRSKIEDGELFDLRVRRSKTRDFFNLRTRRTKNSPSSKNPSSSKNLPSSNNLSPSSEPKTGSKIAVGPVVFLNLLWYAVPLLGSTVLCCATLHYITPHYAILRI